MDNNTDKNITNKSNESTSFIQKIKNKVGKKKIDYFEMFVQGAAISLEAAKALEVALRDEIIDQEELKHIKELEHKGDNHKHKSLEIIETAFITPIDQGDILDVLEGIENLTDSIDNIAKHIYIMRVDERDEFMIDFIDLIVLTCEKVQDLMIAFKQFKKNPDNVINKLIIEINTLEEEADNIYSQSMRHIFKGEADLLTLIKKKEIYQLLEDTLDRCEDVANLVGKIMLKE